MAGTGGRGAERRPLEVEVSNFGPISHGRFVVRPVTVFVGPNNSGKTHASALVHSILSAYRDAGAEGMAGIVRAHMGGREFRAALADMEGAISGAGSGRAAVPPRCAEVATSMALRHFEARLLHCIMRNFGAGMGDLVRAGCKSATVRIDYSTRTVITVDGGQASVKSDFSGARYELACANGQAAVREVRGGGHAEDAADAADADAARLMAGMLGAEDDASLVAMLMLVRMVVSRITEGVPRSRYIPPGRATLLGSYRDIAADAVRGAGQAARPPAGEETLAGIRRDFVSDVIRIGEKDPARAPGRDDDMIADMFGGQIVVLRPDNMMPSIMYRFKNTDIPLHRASAGVAEAAALPIFFDNYVDDGSVLIIDEPESHLHPENQIKVTRHIVRHAKKRNALVLIATHSPAVLEQLSLMLKMSQLTAAQRTRTGNGANDCVLDGDIAPYVFSKAGNGGYAINEIEHSPEIGILQDEFIKVDEALYKDDVSVERILEQ